MHGINLNGELLEFPFVMGIINVNSDSFYDKSRALNEEQWLTMAEKHLQEGAKVLDVGFASSRPGAAVIDAKEEVSWVEKVVPSLVKHFPDAHISVDTYNSLTARAAIDSGAHIINDISAGSIDEGMHDFILKNKIPYVAMHMRGIPQNMQKLTDYQNLIAEVLTYFADLKNKFHAAGHNDLIIDPGIGFAKTAAQNFEIIRYLNVFKQLDLPLLVGVSRKSLIYQTLDIVPEEALNGTTALNSFSLIKGADILRVHDVKEACEVVELYKMLPD